MNKEDHRRVESAIKWCEDNGHAFRGLRLYPDCNPVIVYDHSSEGWSLKEMTE